MFDVYSHCDNVKGTLVLQKGCTLVYQNTHVASELLGGSEKVAAGQSYLLVSGDQEPINIDFETEHGAGDGMDDSVLIEILIHRNKALLEREYTEERSLAIRSLQLALDSLQKHQAAA